MCRRRRFVLDGHQSRVALLCVGMSLCSIFCNKILAASLLQLPFPSSPINTIRPANTEEFLSHTYQLQTISIILADLFRSAKVRQQSAIWCRTSVSMRSAARHFCHQQGHKGGADTMGGRHARLSQQGGGAVQSRAWHCIAMQSCRGPLAARSLALPACRQRAAVQEAAQRQSRGMMTCAFVF